MNAAESMTLQNRFFTHEVGNQPPPLVPYDVWETDLPMREALEREGGAWGVGEVSVYAGRVGDELMEAGRLANENRPRLKAFDPFGHRVDEIEFHPAYHQLMAAAVRHGVPNFGWRNADRPGAHVVRAALCYLDNQADQGHCCPMTMTYACVPTIRHQPELAESWLPRILSTEYDPRSLPATHKAGNTIGMGMTEKQGGSDVRANTTRALAVGARGPGQLYELVGHKWFFSAPMCDAHLVLAQTDGGLSCFLMPRFGPDGRLNAVRVQRLKDKLGDWSNASSEVELCGAAAWMVGEEGRGVATILEMVALTRQDCVIGSSSLMRQALVQAIHHARHRSAFGKPLILQPLMSNVLADLALESEAAVALAMRVARAVDAGSRDAGERAFARLATAVAKYWICKRAPAFVNEAQECLGGAGYVEDVSMARLYRQAPLNSIWEGCGNIQCLDVLRAMSREPVTREVLFTELALAKGAHPALDAAVALLAADYSDRDALELRSRDLVERTSLVLQAALLFRAGNQAIADAFCASRLAGEHGANFGTLPPTAPIGTLIERALPA